MNTQKPLIYQHKNTILFFLVISTFFKIINVYKANCMARKVVQLDLENNIVAIYNSLHDAERISGVWMTQIKKCCDKVPMYNTAKGYKWCWESDYRE